jgi:NhaP-type Na+/H+ or K+/H+ antiporter
MGFHDLGTMGWRWWAMDLLWSTAGGLAIGAGLGALIGRLVVYMRTRHHGAVGLDEFLSLGLLATSYGAAQLVLASGFLAVFAAGLALQRVRDRPLAGTAADAPTPNSRGHDSEDWAIHSHHASSAMTRAVRDFNEQLEKVAELAIVLIVGAMLPYIIASAALWWFVPLVFAILRPVAVLAGMAGGGLPGRQLAPIAWFGIRGIGSVYYLMFALNHGVSGPLAQELIAVTLGTVGASIIVHGASVTPLMSWYARHNP